MRRGSDTALWRETTARPFVILFLARSGSTYLTELLRLHPQLKCAGERFKGFKMRQVEQIANYLSGGGQEHSAIGFKTKLADVHDPQAFCELLRGLPAQVIHLTRRNLVKQTVSLARAIDLNDRTGKWNLYEESNRTADLKIDPAAFRRWLSGIEAGKGRLSEYVMGLDLATLTIQYEDLLTKRDETLEMVAGFLGVAPKFATPSIKKNTPDDLRRTILNFDELRAEFGGTRFESMFDEVLVGADGSPEGHT